jgi:hypothetical protein
LASHRRAFPIIEISKQTQHNAFGWISFNAMLSLF